MEEARRTTVEVFKAVKDGQCWQIGLSATQVTELLPKVASEPGWKIERSIEEVGIAHGVVLDWNSEGGPPLLHVHWPCPLCGREHICDFDPPADSNPVLWFCDHDYGMCLVHWRYEEAS